MATVGAGVGEGVGVGVGVDGGGGAGCATGGWATWTPATSGGNTAVGAGLCGGDDPPPPEPVVGVAVGVEVAAGGGGVVGVSGGGGVDVAAGGGVVGVSVGVGVEVAAGGGVVGVAVGVGVLVGGGALHVTCSAIKKEPWTPLVFQLAPALTVWGFPSVGTLIDTVSVPPGPLNVKFLFTTRFSGNPSM